MKRTILATLVLLSVPLWARAFEVRGTVVTPEGMPVAGAVVLHRPSGTRDVTDARGAFALDLPQGARVRLEVIHPDHYEQEFDVPRKDLARGVVLTVLPVVRRKEEIVVTALRHPEARAAIPVAETVVAKGALAEAMPSNITEGLSATPGVAALGSGGFSLVPSVRGLARRRVLYLVDDARLSSERRTGPNASFISPEDVERIEVLRSPASVLYGSDAIGGVIHILTREPELRPGIRGRVHARYGTVNAEKGAGLSLEGAKGATGFLLSFQGVDAGDYASPSGRVLQSRFAQGSILAKIVHRTEKREIVASVLGARGRDIGKPNRDSLNKPTWYPEERQNLFQFRWIERKVANGELSFEAYVDPNSLETRTDRIDGYRTKTSTSRTRSTEYGVQLSFGKKLGKALRLEGGADLFGQAGAEAVTRDTSFAADGTARGVTGELPYARGSRTDTGLFVSADYSGFWNLDLVGGVRWDSLSMKAAPGGGTAVATSDGKAIGFLAASLKITESLVGFVNVSRAYRVPSLNERYYTGISGRGFIVAQPGLRPETSLNADGGFRFYGRRFFAGLYGFAYAIDGLIERYTVSPGLYTYGNIDKGRLKGLELEVEYFPVPGWKVFGNMFVIRGRNAATGGPLNDVPPVQLLAGTKAWVGRFSAEVDAMFRLRKDNPGPAEIAVPASTVVNARAAYRVSPSLSFYARLGNLFDTAYIARPDAEAMEEPGRSLTVGAAVSF
ncbi:MAG TPA: TonB-dependent receptor [Acidobacteriota bacterium]|nr:TonB-dependent receptor [Acidobacteriota bacterium]